MVRKAAMGTITPLLRLACTVRERNRSPVLTVRVALFASALDAVALFASALDWIVRCHLRCVRTSLAGSILGIPLMILSIRVVVDLMNQITCKLGGSLQHFVLIAATA